MIDFRPRKAPFAADLVAGQVPAAGELAYLAHVALEAGSTVVCVLTGHGLKDTAAVETLTAGTTVVEPGVEAILAEVSA